MNEIPDARSTDEFTFTHLTPDGEGGIGIFHLCGEGVRTMLSDIFHPASGSVSWDGDGLYYGWLQDDEERVDEVVVRVVPDGHSLTGRRTVEINTHSGPAILQKVRSLLEEHGGTERNSDTYLLESEEIGALDALQREAYEDLLSVETRRGAVALAYQLQGELSEYLVDLRECLSSGSFDERRVTDVISDVISRGKSGRALTDPPELCILGPPNAGKSTLMNTLSQENRSIVHEEAGTTRDVVQETVYASGYPLRVRDTAGMHTSGDQVEREGIRKGKEMAETADLILWLGESMEDAVATPEVIADKSTLRVKNKEDLNASPDYGLTEYQGHRVFRISAEQEEGISSLRQEILRSLDLEHDLTKQKPMPFRSEHVETLKTVRELLRTSSISEAVEALTEMLQYEDET